MRSSDRGVYGISVTAELVGTGAQNLRAYERRGLVEPQRTSGGTRLYSDNDVRRLQRISELLAAGLNLAGVAMVLELESDNALLRAQLASRRRRASLLTSSDVHAVSGTGVRLGRTTSRRDNRTDN